jgi:ankyrin repeat protein
MRRRSSWSTSPTTASRHSISRAFGRAETVRLLVERGASLERLSEASFARVRPLGTAAFARQLEAARVLLEAGADPNGAGAGGFVPLETAEANGDEELVRLLLEHGATA